MKRKVEKRYEHWIPAVVGILLAVSLLVSVIPMVGADTEEPRQESSELLDQISIGCNRVWMEQELGIPRFVGAKKGYRLCAYVTEDYVVQAAYDRADSLRAYLITALPGERTIVIQDDTFYPVREPVRLGLDSYYDYPGAPVQVWGYVSQGNNRGFYGEEYYPAGAGNYDTYYLASVDYGVLKDGLEAFLGQIQLGLSEVDDEVGSEQIQLDQTLANRKSVCPNSYGVSDGKADIWELFGTYDWWNSQKLRNQVHE